jgi:hypothetical protein
VLGLVGGTRAAFEANGTRQKLSDTTCSSDEMKRAAHRQGRMTLAFGTVLVASITGGQPIPVWTAGPPNPAC